MLSVIAADVLAVADSAVLKSLPSCLSPCLIPPDEYQDSTWATDNSALYLSSAQSISRYDPSSNQLKVLHILDNRKPIRCIATKNTTSVLLGAGAEIHILECNGPTSKIVQSLGPFNQDILTISLSNDSTLLACGLSNAIYVHNLTTGSQITLRGLPSKLSIAMCKFHPHIRTRLLVGFLDRLFVYDTTRPSAPLKVIPMNEAGECISALACSPFSKTLVAVAMTNGVVGLVDLDKDKGLFRMVDLKVPLTTIEFSPEGASIYLGTGDGKLLIQDLRALDKAPKSIIVSKVGNPIDTLAVQKKLKSSPDDFKAKGTPISLAKKTAGVPVSKSTPSPLRARATRPGAATATPVRKVPLKNGTPKQTPLSKMASNKKVLSPARDPHGNSTSLDTKDIAKSATVRVKKLTPALSASPNPKPRSSSAKASSTTQTMRRTSSSASVRTRRSSAATENVEPSAITQPQSATGEAISSASIARARIRSRTMIPSGSVPVLPSQRSTRTISGNSSSSAVSRQKQPPSTSPPPPVPAVPTEFLANLRSPVSKPAEGSRTPSPDLPDIRTDPLTPALSQKKKGMAVLGLGTPEVKEWIKAGRGRNHGAKGKSRVKSVGFKDNGNEPDEQPCRNDELGGSQSHENEECERERSLSMQISPRRPLPTNSSSQAQSHGHSQSWDASPLRPRHPTHMQGTPTAGSAHELLKTIVKDVMFDFQKETKAEMMGLHLDLVRMGRGWKQELRTLMEEYVGDLNDLREENLRLRDENDRLRRGY